MLKENQVLVIVEWRDRLNWSIGPSFHGIIGKEKDTRKSIQENPGGLWFFKKKKGNWKHKSFGYYSKKQSSRMKRKQMWLRLVE